MGAFSPRRVTCAAVAGTAAWALAGCNLGATPVTISTSVSSPDAAVAGDLNGDGLTDLVIVNDPCCDVLGASFTVAVADGSGGFEQHQVAADVSGIGEVRLADFDEDGALDLLASTYSMSPGSAAAFPAVLVYRGDGAGGFGARSLVVDSWRSVAAADVTGDGHVDAVTGNLSLSVQPGDGARGFAAPSAYTFGPGQYENPELQPADMDGDGDIDVVVSAINVDTTTFERSPMVVVMVNDGAGAFAPGPIVLDAAESSTPADVDGDGDLDVVRVGDSGLQTLLHDGGGTLTPGPLGPMPGGVLARLAGAGDIDGDGHVDLVVASAGQRGAVMYGDGQGGFGRALPLVTAGGPSGPTAWNGVVVADVLGDARPDAVFVGPQADRVVVHENRS